MAERRSAAAKETSYKDYSLQVETRGGDTIPIDVRFFKVADGRMPFNMTIFKEIAVKGCAVVDGKNGLFVSMPSYKGKDGKYYDYVFPVSAETRESLFGQLVKLADVIWAEM